jgi:hypothetical protein
MVTGVAGAVLGYVGFRRSTAMKALDLRVELRKAVNDADIDLSNLKELLDLAHRSRHAVASARHTARSGAMEIWEQGFERDKAKWQTLKDAAPSPENKYEGLGPAQLEAELVSVHRLRRQLQDLTERYRASLKSDDDERAQIREDMRDMVRNAK